MTMRDAAEGARKRSASERNRVPRMADTLPPLLGGRRFSASFQALPRQARAVSDAGVGAASANEATDSRAITLAFLWLALFAAAEVLLNLPSWASSVPGTELRLISAPMALLALGLMLRPSTEAPLYCLIYVIAAVAPALGTPEFDFVLARVAVETFQTVAIVCVTVRFFWQRLGEPLVVAGWVVTALLICAAGATLMVGVLELIPLHPAEVARELGGSRGLAWRY